MRALRLYMAGNLFKKGKQSSQSYVRVNSGVLMAHDGTFLQRRLNINTHCSERATLGRINWNLSRVSVKLAQQRVRFSVHCFREKGEIVSALVLWKQAAPNHSKKLTYPRVISGNIVIPVQDLPAAVGRSWCLVRCCTVCFGWGRRIDRD